MKYVHIAAVIFTITGVSQARGQSAAAFEVISIKPSDPSASRTQIGIEPGGVFRAANQTLKNLIAQAYDVRDFQISGGPGWIDTQRYDIVAKGNRPAVSEDDLVRMTDAQRDDFQKQMQERLRALMADRFQLKLHRETKEMPVYALVLAKNGARIHAVADNFTPQSGMRMRRNDQGKTEVTGTQVRLASLVWMLSNQVGRTVTDKTGLAGNFDFKLVFAPDLADSDGPSVFTALEEQLGLKLDAQKGPVEVLVIDRAEKASEN